MKSLCHKILQNVSILTNADRCSLFLVKGEKEKYFVSTLFDVSSDSTIEQMEKREEIRVNWGTGIVGFAAALGNLFSSRIAIRTNVSLIWLIVEPDITRATCFVHLFTISVER